MSTVTELGARVDTVQVFLIWMMAFWFIACNTVLVYLMLRYRRKTEAQPAQSQIKGHHLLEMIWTLVPTILCVIIFYFGINVWQEMRTPPPDAMEIQVRAQRWAWTFNYPDGRSTAADLYVPQGRAVRLTMKSNDVLHSFFVPEFRVKEDVVPSIFTHLWFRAERTGSYNIFCTEYCGKDHSAMLGKVHVLDAETWERFENNLPLDPNAVPKTPVERGEELYVKRACKGCHSSDGSAVIGPTFQGLYGRQATFSDGSSQAADENYIMESIKNPNAKLVAGFPAGQMPAFEGQLTDDDISDIIAFIKTLKKD